MSHALDTHADRSADPAAAAPTPFVPRKKRTALKTIGLLLLILIVAGVVARLFMPSAILWYVNRTLDQSPLYDGKVGGIDVHLYRGAYAIRDVRINKKTGSVPVPLFAAKRVDLAVEWGALYHGRVVGAVRIEKPELNFVDGGDDGGGKGGDGSGQTGAGGPWLAILRDLFPFKINSIDVVDGSVHFRSFDKQVPVDVYMSALNANVDNLTNVREEITPLLTTVSADALVMDQAKFEYKMRFDPFSYKPTFELTTRVLNLDVTKVNDLTRGYGAFDFERGWFDLVIDVKSTEGQLEGYVKPLFRDLKVLDLKKDLEDDNVVQVFWEALVGGAKNILKNQPRDQFGTLVPFTGSVGAPETDVIALIGNVLRNAFIRAYLPRLDGDGAPVVTEGLEFGPARVIDPVADASADTSADTTSSPEARP